MGNGQIAVPQGRTIGYVRVSTFDQNTARQLDGIQLYKKYEDKASGKDTFRPQLTAALEYMRPGDTFVVHSMDRLARNLSDLLAIVERLTGEGIRVQFMKEHLEFTGDDSPVSKLMLAVIGAAAEFERDMIRERQREGIAKAKASGVYTGRKVKLTAKQIAQVRARAAAGEMKSALAREFGVTRMSIYRYIDGGEA